MEFSRENVKNAAHIYMVYMDLYRIYAAALHDIIIYRICYIACYAVVLHVQMNVNYIGTHANRCCAKQIVAVSLYAIHFYSANHTWAWEGVLLPPP